MRPGSQGEPLRLDRPARKEVLHATQFSPGFRQLGPEPHSRGAPPPLHPSTPPFIHPPIHPLPPEAEAYCLFLLTKRHGGCRISGAFMRRVLPLPESLDQRVATGSTKPRLPGRRNVRTAMNCTSAVNRGGQGGRHQSDPAWRCGAASSIAALRSKGVIEKPSRMWRAA